MGQQQLLLVILVTILVGIATLVAFNVFGTAAEEANRDAVRQDILAAAAQAQAIWTRPAMMDGAGQDFTVLSEAEILSRLNIPGSNPTGSLVENENGDYSVPSRTATSITILAVPSSDTDNIQAVISRNATTGQWEIAWSDGGGGEE
jgi:Tfp pilus assembly protein PilE